MLTTAKDSKSVSKIQEVPQHAQKPRISIFEGSDLTSHSPSRAFASKPGLLEISRLPAGRRSSHGGGPTSPGDGSPGVRRTCVCAWSVTRASRKRSSICCDLYCCRSPGIQRTCSKGRPACSRGVSSEPAFTPRKRGRPMGSLPERRFRRGGSK